MPVAHRLSVRLRFLNEKKEGGKERERKEGRKNKHMNGWIIFSNACVRS